MSGNIMSGNARPALIPGLSAIAERFDHLLLDQWGVLHDGRAVFAGARAAVAALGRAGKRALVLSNSGKRAAENAARLAALGLPPEAYGGIVTSGEACWQLLRRRDEPPFDGLGSRCLLVTRGGDRSVVEGLPLTLAAGVDDADFILLAGLDDALAEPAAWRSRWRPAVARGLPMICANPDLTMIGPAGLAPAPGSLARLYEALGGAVTYIGKPHAPIYEECLRQLGGPDPRRVLAVGDSLDHDIRGGAAMGMGTVLVTGGILAPEFAAAADDAAMVETALRLARASGDRPDWLLARLAW
jgi:HAD superfamily hydrolase (TIGR01459 family)